MSSFDTLTELYFSAVKLHNSKKPANRHEDIIRCNTILECVTALYDSATAGQLLIAADMHIDPTLTKWMCGGMLFDSEPVIPFLENPS